MLLCTDGTSIEDLKAFNVDMKGLELASKVSTKEPYFLEKMLLIRLLL
jgi:carbamoyl-phosphate synthase small subunit